MKILHIVRNLDIGGIEINLRNLLATPLYKNINNFVLTLNDNSGPICEDLKHLGVEVLCCPINDTRKTFIKRYRLGRIFHLIFSSVIAIIRLWWIFRGLDVDVIHANYRWFLFEQMICAKLVGKKFIWTIHGQYKYTDFERKQIKFGIRLLGEKNLVITSVSKAAMSSTVPFIDFDSEGIKYQIIYNGVDLFKYTKRNLANISKENRSIYSRDQRVVVGSLGRLVHDKGYDILVKAAELVIYEVPYIVFCVGGEGEKRSKLEEKIDQLGIQEKFIFLGNVENVPDYFQQIDIYVQPSRKEGLGIALIEAMATGLPVIASNTGGIPELLNYGEAGFLVEKENPESLAHAIITMVKDKELRKKYSQNSFRRSENFSINKIAGEYIQLYEEISMKNSE